MRRFAALTEDIAILCINHKSLMDSRLILMDCIAMLGINLK